LVQARRDVRPDEKEPVTGDRVNRGGMGRGRKRHRDYRGDKPSRCVTPTR
jgi:hypothetical protein